MVPDAKKLPGILYVNDWSFRPRIVDREAKTESTRESEKKPDKKKKIKNER